MPETEQQRMIEEVYEDFDHAMRELVEKNGGEFMRRMKELQGETIIRLRAITSSPSEL